jgi:CDP-glucose 4,6-dehydratase
MLNLMESLKVIKKKCSVIIITSDKVYKNIEQQKGYKEDDILHGLDPYSASKSCADILAQSYINSILCNNTNINFGIARAGNVIGGEIFLVIGLYLILLNHQKSKKN